MVGKQPEVRGQNGRIVRLVLPFVVAAVTTVIVWFVSARGPAPTTEGGTRIVDTGQPQLINAVFAGLAALMVTVIVVKLYPKRKRRRSR